MPTNKTEKYKDGFFIAHEANGSRSREADILITGQNVEAGLAVGKITGSSKITAWNLAAGDGSEVLYGFIYHTKDATLADANVVTLVRDCELEEDSVSYLGAPEIAAGKAAAEALGIILRPSGVTSTLAEQIA